MQPSLPMRGREEKFDYGLHSNEHPAPSAADPGPGDRPVPVRTHHQGRPSHCRHYPYPAAGVHISAEGHTSDPEALQYLYNAAKQNGSVLEIAYNSDFMGAITETLESTNTVNVITGQPGDESSVLYTLWDRFPGIKFFTADADGRLDMVGAVRVAD